MRVALGALAASVALIAAGCGGGGGGGAGGGPTAGASFVPASAPLYIYVNSDFGSGQWKALDALSKKFPDRARLLGLIRSELQKQGVDWDADVKPAVGPETDIGFLRFKGDTGNAVGLTKPDDKARLDALLKKLDQSDPTSPPSVTRVVDGWTVISDAKSALDAAEQAHKGKSLADDGSFKSAIGDLPAEALAKIYVNGPAVVQEVQSATGQGSIPGLGNPSTIVASLEAKPNGLELQGISKGGGGKGYTAKFLDEVPAGTLAFLSFNNVGKQLDQIASATQAAPYLQIVQSALGVTVQEIASLFKSEGALYVRPGAPFPEVTLALRVQNATQARATIDKLASRAAGFLHGSVGSVDVGGVAAKRITFPNFAVYYAVFDGKLVISDATSGITGLREKGSKLKDDAVFKEAKDAAGMPDRTNGLLYVNIKDTVPLIESFATVAGAQIPPEVTNNLPHLRTFLAFGSSSSSESRFKAFLEIK